MKNLPIGRMTMPRQANHSSAVPSCNAQFDDLLHRLGGELGLPRLTFNERRSCFLKFDDVVVHLRHPAGEWLEMTCVIAVLKQPVQSTLLEQVLAANVQGRDGTMALDSASRTLLMQDRLAVQQADLPTLRDRLKILIDGVERWRQTLPGDQVTLMQAC